MNKFFEEHSILLVLIFGIITVLLCWFMVASNWTTGEVDRIKFLYPEIKNCSQDDTSTGAWQWVCYGVNSTWHCSRQSGLSQVFCRQVV